MMHKIKRQIQPERDGKSWNASIAEARQSLLEDIEDSPSPGPHLRENLQKIYKRAVELALMEIGLDYAPLPDECPWDLDTLLNG